MGYANFQIPLVRFQSRPFASYAVTRPFIDIPLKNLILDPEKYLPASSEVDTYIICRLGNDSQIAAESLRQVEGAGIVKDVIGGLKAWAKQVDPHLPLY